MAADSPNKPPETTLSEFFESKPLNTIFKIAGVTFRALSPGPSPGMIMSTSMPRRTEMPAIRLWCDNDECDGFRNFDPDNRSEELLVYEKEPEVRDTFLLFVCRNCRRSAKKYAISYRYNFSSKELLAEKLGEDPPLSFHVPARLRKLVGSELKKFKKGLGSEAHGFGVGAFAYYRQVVEDQKNRLFDEIIKVAQLGHPSSELIAELEEAKAETSFSSAVDKIKHAIPEALRIHGHHNPLTLLHSALSDGLHAGTDEECLEIAQDIRVILSDLSERLQNALKDNQELTKSVSRLQNRRKKAS
jgi:hypothetical protein